MPKLVHAFFRLIRWPNLVFIALTQLLFYLIIVRPAFATVPGGIMTTLLRPALFIMLCSSSMLIAAAGYIINDYFDLHIDRVNKPERLVVEKHIKRRYAIIWHWIFSSMGIILGCYVSWRIHNIVILFSNILCVALLWFYSTTFKKKLLIGNILISLLTSWVILILYVCEFRIDFISDPVYHYVLSRIFKFAVLYAGFAFIISLVREVIKDIEDREGDARYQCRTMPIAWGINVSKVFIATWLIVLVASISVLQVYMLHYGRWISVCYCIIAIILPLLLIIRDLYKAVTTADYHRLSSRVKIVMLAGILSMLFFLLG